MPTSTEFEASFEHLRMLAFRSAYRVLGDTDQADDAASEALVRTLGKWRKVSRLDYRDAWVTRVAANVAIDTVRKRRNSSQQPADSAVHDQSTLDRLATVSALAALPKRQREVVVLRFFADMREPEIASALGISANSVKKHMSRAFVALRIHLDETTEEVGNAIV